MSFGRIPFQFSVIDPAERQLEYQRRFGLLKRDDMRVDFLNSDCMGPGSRSNSAASSPRLQHRVPVFVEGSDEPIKMEKPQSNNIDNSKKPNVRVVPIEIEGASEPMRQRSFSGPSVCSDAEVFPKSPLKHYMQDNSVSSRKRIPSGDSKPRIHNIPIQIVKTDNQCNGNIPCKVSKSNSFKKDKGNGCCMSKVIPVVKDKSRNVEQKEPDFVISLKKINDVKEDLKGYQFDVENFTGTSKDKQYRYLDEMLTRCMLKLDDVDTMGNENVRAERKAAVKKVQACIDLLEEKVNSQNETEKMSNEEEMEVNQDSETTPSDKTNCESKEINSLETSEKASNETEMENNQDSEVIPSDKDTTCESDEIEMEDQGCKIYAVSSEKDLKITNCENSEMENTVNKNEEIPEVEMQDVQEDVKNTVCSAVSCCDQKESQELQPKEAEAITNEATSDDTEMKDSCDECENFQEEAVVDHKDVGCKDALDEVEDSVVVQDLSKNSRLTTDECNPSIVITEIMDVESTEADVKDSSNSAKSPHASIDELASPASASDCSDPIESRLVNSSH